VCQICGVNSVAPPYTLPLYSWAPRNIPPCPDQAYPHGRSGTKTGKTKINTIMGLHKQVCRNTSTKWRGEDLGGGGVRARRLTLRRRRWSARHKTMPRSSRADKTPTTPKKTHTHTRLVKIHNSSSSGLLSSRQRTHSPLGPRRIRKPPKRLPSVTH
jgi:hypothetical protein